MSARQRARMAAAMALAAPPSSSSDSEDDEADVVVTRPNVITHEDSSSSSSQEEDEHNKEVEGNNGDDNSDADSLEKFPTKSSMERFAAAFDDSSSESSDRGSDSESQEEDAPTSLTTTTARKVGNKVSNKKVSAKGKQKRKKAAGAEGSRPPAGSAVADFDLAELENHLKAIEKEEGSKAAGKMAPAISFLKVDPLTLDADSLLKQRLHMDGERRRGGARGGNRAAAAPNAAAGAANAAGQGGRRPAGSGTSGRSKRITKMGGARRFIFGMPKDEWADAPSFGAGGIGMRREEGGGPGMFRFIWSDDYKEVSQQYERIQASGDANRLVEFLAEYPYHIDALLQLASVFIRTGDVNKSYDLVRRALFYLNWGEHEGFNPCGTCCRLDPSIPENASYFRAVFFNMKLVGMFGCPSVSAGLAKLLLSLDPTGDSMNLWLLLDYYLMASGEAAEFEEVYAGLCTMSLGIGAEKQSLCISDLPNWSVSSALCAFLRSKATGLFEEYAEEESGIDYKALSNERLQASFLKYPYLLWGFASRILNTSEHRGFSGTAASHVSRLQWQALQNHPFYASGKASASSLLLQLSELYDSRCGELWTNVQSGAGQAHLLDIDKWIYDNAMAVINTPGFSAEEALESCRTQWSNLNACVEKYRLANPEDFTDNITRFPLDANPLDPRFTDPNTPLPINRDDVERTRALRRAQQNQPRRQRAAQMRQMGGENDMHWQFDANTMGGQEYLDPLVDRIARLPVPLRNFIVGIVERRLEQMRGTEDFDVLLDTESVLAEALYMQGGDDDEARVVDPNELARIVAEAMNVDPFDFLHDVQVRAEQTRREDAALDLNQPLLQLFIRSFLPWNHLR